MPATAAPRPQALDRRGAMRSFDPEGAQADLSGAIAQSRATGTDTSLAARPDSLGVLELENGDLEAAQVYLHVAVTLSAAECVRLRKDVPRSKHAATDQANARPGSP